MQVTHKYPNYSICGQYNNNLYMQYMARPNDALFRAYIMSIANGPNQQIIKKRIIFFYLTLTKFKQNVGELKCSKWNENLDCDSKTEILFEI